MTGESEAGPPGSGLPWLSAAVFVAVLVGGGLLLLSDPVQEGPLQSLTQGITRLSAPLIEAVGYPVEVRYRGLRSPEGPEVGIANECNGAWAHLILTAALLAYPAAWRTKAVGLVVANVALFTVNLGRIVSLFALAVSKPEWFRLAHVYVWQFAIIGVALALFLVWASWAEERGAT